MRFPATLICTMVAAGVLAAADQPPVMATEAGPRLVTGDLVRVQVYQEPELERELRVEPDGTIVLPLIGSVQVGGRTTREVEREIVRRYDADFLVNPQITVTVAHFAARRVSVTGMVNRPGAVMFSPQGTLSLAEALDGAGGLTAIGDPHRIRVSRTAGRGSPRQIVVDLDRAAGNDGGSEGWWLLPGDTVTVVARRP